MRLLVILFIFSCLTVLISSPKSAHAEMSSSNYRITSTVLSGGGNTMSSASYQLESTLGQSSMIGSSAGNSYILESGFWYTVLLVILGDVDGSGEVDLIDLITALQITTGQNPDQVIKEADVNGDGKIGLSESIMILKKLSE